MLWLQILNFLLTANALLFLGMGISGICGKEECLSACPRRNIEAKLPVDSFSVPQAYKAIEEGPLSLKWHPPQMLLPDLRNEILFLNKNLRPDCQPGKAPVQIALRSSQERIDTFENKKIYLIYSSQSPFPVQGGAHPAPSPIWGEASVLKGEYRFSPDNQTTPLWCEMHSAGQDNAIEVRVSLIDEKGGIVASPRQFQAFKLNLQEEHRQFSPFEIGGHRTDPTLLIRQKAKWMGKDVFFQVHGGKEYAWTHPKERIDFLDEQAPYSCFVEAGDFLVWEASRWRVAEKGEATCHLPLLVVKKIEEKLLSFDLWDQEGKGRMPLNLIRSRDLQGFPNLQQEIKFVGAKTWAQFIIECRDARMTVKPNEWLLMTNEGWVALDTPEQIDAYVDLKLQGPLFIIDRLEKQNGHHCLSGHLFNSSRTEIQQIKIPAQAVTGIGSFPLAPPFLQNSVTLNHEE